MVLLEHLLGMHYFQQEIFCGMKDDFKLFTSAYSASFFNSRLFQTCAITTSACLNFL